MQLSILRDKKYYLNDNLFVFFLAAIVFFISLYFSPYYYAGDQVAYTKYYNAVAGHNVLDAYFLQIKYLSSYEPLYAVSVWVFSHFMGKDTFDSMLNFFLCYSAVSVLFHLGASKRLIVLFVLANFYILVLYFAADRLKLSFILFFLGMDAFYHKKEVHGYSLLLFSVLAHLQILLFFASVMSVLLARSLLKIATKFVVNVKELVLMMSFIIFSLLVSIFFHEHIVNKLGFYLSNSITEVFKPGVFLVLSLFSPAKNYYIVASFIPLLFAAFIVSGDRVVMMAYLLFVFYAMSGKGVSRRLIWVTTLYFTYKSYFFIHNIVLFGNGFA